ncbi:MAG: hypothetical protein CMM61_12090 [Rhodospirillaceae bacterium]|nr:hypothetical protein [Rhodospirillaceae bacterium]|tara:strand:+ start:216 stop:698 length:483 start_codon:yes stop_codon:yes gene_type:complete
MSGKRPAILDKPIKLARGDLIGFSEQFIERVNVIEAYYRVPLEGGYLDMARDNFKCFEVKVLGEPGRKSDKTVRDLALFVDMARELKKNPSVKRAAGRILSKHPEYANVTSKQVEDAEEKMREKYAERIRVRFENLTGKNPEYATAQARLVDLIRRLNRK